MIKQPAAAVFSFLFYTQCVKIYEGANYEKSSKLEAEPTLIRALLILEPTAHKYTPPVIETFCPR